ncbi:hypothetical protein AB0E88_01040 [Streptomyces sp. NPDC028635]|uniref:hypothetical protein n=1 Tax=Streptomyces sp. NPDC028635 TaxID=3154800 RepID=UPI0034103FB5
MRSIRRPGRRERARWAALAVAVGLLTGGCSPSGGDGSAAGQRHHGGTPSATTATGSPVTPSGSASGNGSAGASPTTPFTPDAAKVPKTAADAERLAEAVALRPEEWRQDFVAQKPAASAPGTWAVLDDSCRWQRRKLPAGVLAGVSRYSELPGGTDAATIKVTAMVTVHASVTSADQELSTTLEEVLRCPDQQIRSAERVTGLGSLGNPFGKGDQKYADDTVYEAGHYDLDGAATNAQGGADQGQFTYQWLVARLSTVTVGVSARCAAGCTQQQLSRTAIDGLVRMLQRIRTSLGTVG